MEKLKKSWYKLPGKIKQINNSEEFVGMNFFVKLSSLSIHLKSNKCRGLNFLYLFTAQHAYRHHLTKIYSLKYEGIIE